MASQVYPDRMTHLVNGDAVNDWQSSGEEIDSTAPKSAYNRYIYSAPMTHLIGWEHGQRVSMDNEGHKVLVRESQTVRVVIVHEIKYKKGRFHKMVEYLIRT